ncbi:Vicilin-like antimicrobial peptides 2-1 [Apostasia shenzhenica]|uniref:Vicilin-like antimicrobial peptides 2-1 n=1 Tax=Apostasia shenzhenica TaxID=1088818 RepID=A0A2I0BB28_9ASPA|nr:Vicilin-like antimicrobial peptides 2-1 [Apostasia shenzhenica]
MKKETGVPLTLLLLVLLTLSPLSAASDGFGIEKCRQECRQYPLYDQGMRRGCELECEQREGGGVGRSKYEERERHEWQEGGNPYIFGKESFEDYVLSHGRAKVLKKFSDLSPLLRGIANYRLLVLEADPHTFVMPKHLDADCVLYVANGEGAIFILHEKSRESHSLRQGDVIRVWAGSITYLINKSNNQKLKIATFLNPVGNPGQFEVHKSSS